jgi:hypothetical protein
MIPSQLVQRIEQHWQAIATAAVEQAGVDPEIPHHRSLDADELQARVHDLVQNLVFWITARDETQIGHRYELLGKSRFAEGTPLAEVVYKLQLIERKVLEYVQDQNLALSAVEIYGELEMLRSLHRFFALITYHLVKGYETAARGRHDEPSRWLEASSTV